MIRSVLRAVVAFAFAVAVHVALFLVFTDVREPLLLVQGGKIEVKFGAEGLDTSAARADEGAAQTEQLETPSTEEIEDTSEPVAEAEPVPQEPPVRETQPEGALSDDAVPTEPTVEATPAEDAQEPQEQPQERPEPEEQPEPPVDQPKEPLNETVQAEEGTTTETESQDGEQSADSVATAQSGSVTGDEAVAQTNLQAGNSEFDNYAGELVKILTRKRLPASVRSGSARILFTLNEDGSIDEIEVEESSGSKRFDREAIKLVEKAAPFPEPPPGIDLTFSVVIKKD